MNVIQEFGFCAIAWIALTSLTQPDEPVYLVEVTGDLPQRQDFHGGTIPFCHTNSATYITRVTTPALGATEILIRNGGHACVGNEKPDFVESASRCEILSGTFQGTLDEGCDNK